MDNRETDIRIIVSTRAKSRDFTDARRHWEKAIIAYLDEVIVLDEERLMLKIMRRNRRKFPGDRSREELEYFLYRFVVYSHELN